MFVAAGALCVASDVRLSCWFTLFWVWMVFSVAQLLGRVFHPLMIPSFGMCLQLVLIVFVKLYYLGKVP